MSSAAHPPFPLLEVVVDPRSPGDAEALSAALAGLVAADPQLSTRTDPESGLLLLGGVSEAQLETWINELVRIRGVRCDVGAPSVVYRETLGRRAEVDYTHRKQTGGGGQFSRIRVVFEPGALGSGFQFESRVGGGAVPAEFIPGVIKGLESAKENGLLASFPVTDFKATLVDGAYHDVDSSALTFELAARAAFRELRERGAPRLLEPIMRIEATTPTAFTDTVVRDLERRGGRLQPLESRNEHRIVRALAPLANLFGYEEALRDLSRGRAQVLLSLAGYAPSPFSNDSPGPFEPAAAMRA